MVNVGRFIILTIFLSALSAHGQDEITSTIEEAKKSYLHNELFEAAKMLDRSLDLIHNKLLTQLESLFPKHLKGWNADSPSSRIKKDAYNIGLISKRKYYKNGGGPSVEISMETNSTRIARIQAIFVNPANIKQVNNNAKISLIEDLRCIEIYDPIDKFSELIFIPTSSLLISIRGHEMKNTNIAAKYAKKLAWDRICELFP